MKITEIGYLIFSLFHVIYSACTFPSDLRGDWISADRGVLTFTASSLTNYAIRLSASVSSVDFDCDTLQDDQYYLRGKSSFTVFGDVLRPHICLELQNITSDKFYYYIATNVEVTVNERIHVSQDANPVTHGDVCNRQKPFEVATYIMLIRDAVSDTSLAITCPSDIQRTFENVNMVTADGAASCSGSRLDTCSDERLMNYTYSSCSNSLTFSAGGEWRCLYYTSLGSTTYLAVWNMDQSLVSGQTYRIVCYTMQWIDRVLKTTVYPGSCRANQTASSVVSPGVLMTLSDVSVFSGNSKPRKRRNAIEIKNPEDGFDLVPYYVGAVAFALLVLGCVGVCISCRHYKNADKPNRIHTIKVREAVKSPARESTSGIFSCSSTSIEENDFRGTSTPVKRPRIKQKITSPPTSLGEILTIQNTDESFLLQQNNKKIHNNIYDDIHYTYIGQGNLRKTKNVETAEDFYRNNRLYANNETHKYGNNYKRTYKPKRTTQNQNIPQVMVGDYVNPDYYDYDRPKFSERNHINFSERPNYKKPPVEGTVAEDGPGARGRGNITNTVHYFDRRIPMHCW